MYFHSSAFLKCLCAHFAVGKPVKRTMNEGRGGDANLKFEYVTLGSLALVAVDQGSLPFSFIWPNLHR